MMENPNFTQLPQFPQAVLTLPQDFPKGLQTNFSIGSRVRWIPMPSTDWGIIIGLQFAYLEQKKSWHPRYCIFLDPDSPSRAWINSDWAWEWDLEPFGQQTIYTNSQKS